MFFHVFISAMSRLLWTAFFPVGSDVVKVFTADRDVEAGACQEENHQQSCVVRDQNHYPREIYRQSCVFFSNRFLTLATFRRI